MDSCWISSKSFFCLYWGVYGILDTSCVPLTFSQPELSLIPATAAVASFVWAPTSLLRVHPDSIRPLGPTTCLFPSLLMPQWDPVWEPLGTHQNVFTEKRDLSFSSRDSAEMCFMTIQAVGQGCWVTHAAASLLTHLRVGLPSLPAVLSLGPSFLLLGSHSSKKHSHFSLCSEGTQVKDRVFLF